MRLDIDKRLRAGATGLTLLWLLCGSSLSAVPLQDRPAALPAEETVGVPWTGERGITETVAEIMERERHAPPIPAGPARETKPRFDLRRLPRKPNPSAPAVSQWPSVEGTDLRKEQILPDSPQTVGTSFLGTQLAESGDLPPDSVGAVGPTQVLVPSNGRFKVFDRNGVLGGLNVSADTFFDSVRNGSGTTDPQVRYDRLSGRWFLTMINLATPDRVLIAVSSGSTITDTSSFTFFQFQHDLVGPTPNADTGRVADYDSLGVDANALYIGVNVFNGTTFTGTTGFVVNKADLLASTLTVTAFRQLATASTPGPASPRGVGNDDPSATKGYFIGVDSALFSQLDIRRVSNPGGTPSISGNIILTVPVTTSPINQPAQGSTHPLDGLDDSLFSAAIHTNRNTGIQSLWTAHNIEVNSSGVGASGGGRNGSRWYEIQNLAASPTLNQAGTLFDSAASNPMGYWVPSVAMSGQGHMALGCSRAGNSEYAEIAVAGRLAADTLGTIQGATLAQSSSTSYNQQTVTPQRWGDYSHVAVDPNDDMTMWAFQEYCNLTDSWGVQAIQLLAPPPAAPASTCPASAAAGMTTNIIVVGNSTIGSGFFDPDVSFPNHISAQVSGTGITVNSVTYTDPTHITLNITVAPSAPQTGRTVTVINPDGQSVSSASPILTITTAAPAPTLQTINPVSGTSAGGTPITINGSNFQCGVAVKIGGASASVSGFTPTTVTATTGVALAPGISDVVVTNPDGQGASLPRAFFYDFLDVPPSHPFYSYVVKIATDGVTAGCGGDSYCPDASASRAQMAVFLLRGEHGSAYTPPACAPPGVFGDVTCPGGFAVNWIEQLYHEGITGGCSTNPLRYCPNDAVTRAQMAVFLLRAEHGSGYTPPACAPPGIFSDVACPAGFAVNWIERLYAEAVTGGCSSNPLRYCPDSPNTRGQMAVFLVKAFNLP